MTLSARPRVGVVGAGAIAHAHVPVWLALGAEVRVYSRGGGHAFAKQYGIEVVTDAADIFEFAEIVDILTPTSTHAEIAFAAIARGCHVVCEKPLARTVAEAEAVVAAAEERGVRLFPAHVVRYFPEYVAAREAIRAKTVGDLVACRFLRQSAAPTSDWFFSEQISGGIIMDQMIHDLDQALWLAGPATSVYARATPDLAIRRMGVAHVSIRHESGVLSHAQGLWGASTLPFAYSCDLSGTAGVVRFDSARTGANRTTSGTGGDHSNGIPRSHGVQAASNTGGDYLPVPTAGENPFTLQITDFLTSLQLDVPARVTPDDGVRAVALAVAARESLLAGQPVVLAVTGSGSVADMV
ncbi:MAG: hypothetical protein B5766_01770 [Candidatus Lumbricidophila eiseniae]|uniref:Dehydrogenase n=1 Tax=Candidatus Lumbricidiphila eiseniae TaxID=1969409 RepID=A0A2A6FUL4_9MICO|nr:MAG: hypothetical protein B5766_01770 [Candidatus Lumbricidophila eiseniae]